MSKVTAIHSFKTSYDTSYYQNAFPVPQTISTRILAFAITILVIVVTYITLSNVIAY